MPTISRQNKKKLTQEEFNTVINCLGNAVSAKVALSGTFSLSSSRIQGSSGYLCQEQLTKYLQKVCELYGENQELRDLPKVYKVAYENARVFRSSKLKQRELIETVYGTFKISAIQTQMNTDFEIQFSKYTGSAYNPHKNAGGEYVTKSEETQIPIPRYIQMLSHSVLAYAGLGLIGLGLACLFMAHSLMLGLLFMSIGAVPLATYAGTRFYFFSDKEEVIDSVPATSSLKPALGD